MRSPLALSAWKVYLCLSFCLGLSACQEQWEAREHIELAPLQTCHCPVLTNEEVRLLAPPQATVLASTERAPAEISDEPQTQTLTTIEQIESAHPQSPTKGCIDINKGSSHELEKLPRVGPSLAAKIIARRPYDDPKDLLKVKGIGKKTLNKFKPLLCEL